MFNPPSWRAPRVQLLNFCLSAYKGTYRYRHCLQVAITKPSSENQRKFVIRNYTRESKVSIVLVTSLTVATSTPSAGTINLGDRTWTIFDGTGNEPDVEVRPLDDAKRNFMTIWV